MSIALITVVRGRHDHLRRQRAMLVRSRIPVDQHIIVSMGDPEVRGIAAESVAATTVVDVPVPVDGLPLAAARNAGARAARAYDPEVLIFTDVDCLPDPDLVGRYRAAAGGVGAEALLCGPVCYLPPPPRGGYDLDQLAVHPPHPGRPAPAAGEVQFGADPRLFWSLSFALTPAVWDRIGGFDEGYVGYGAEDTDFGFTAAAAGVPIAWVGGATAYHQWHPVSSPPTEHLDDILRNGARFAARWGWWPMEGWLAKFAAMGLVRRDAATDGWLRVASR